MKNAPSWPTGVLVYDTVYSAVSEQSLLFDCPENRIQMNLTVDEPWKWNFGKANSTAPSFNSASEKIYSWIPSLSCGPRPQRFHICCETLYFSGSLETPNRHFWIFAAQYRSIPWETSGKQQNNSKLVDLCRYLASVTSTKEKEYWCT